MTKKKLISVLLALTLLVSVCCVTASARASLTLAAYGARLTQGNAPGQIVVTYDVSSSKRADEVGVSAIKVYEADGTYVTTIKGMVSNGLIGQNTTCHRDSYTITGHSGTYYYLVLTVTATVGSDTDSREYTTNTVQAP